MSIDIDGKTSLEMGEVFQDGKKEYKVVAEFADNGKTFYVCKSKSPYGSEPYYSNIITYNVTFGRWMFHT